MTKRLSAFPITPADAAGHVDVAALRRLVAPLVAAGVDSIGLLGSTGTYLYLTRDERRRALEAALDEAAGRVPLLVGVGALRTDDAVRLAQDARAAGAAAGLLAPVSYTPLDEDEVFAHFAAVAEAGLPLCIYDNPTTTHFRFTPHLVARLAGVPGVVALKSPGAAPAEAAARLAELRPQVPENFDLGTSGDWFAAEALLAGADTWCGVAAGLFPRVCRDLVEAAAAGDAARVRALDASLIPLWDLFRRHTSLRVIYAAADLRGLCRAAPPRPILPLSEPALREVAAMLARLNLA